MSDIGDFLLGLGACAAFLGAGRLIIASTRTHRRSLPFQLRLFTIALLVRFGFSIIVYQLGFAAVLGDYDASGWLFGDQLRNQWDAAGLGVFEVLFAWRGAFERTSELGYSSHLGYYYLLGTVFFLMGIASRMVAAALNCFIGALITIFAYRTARVLFSEWVAVRVGWWTCLFPSMIIWSGQTVKEPVVILLEVIALYGCVQLKRSGFALRYVLLCASAVVFVTPFRFYAAYIGLGAIAMGLFVPDLKRGRLVFGSALAVATLIGAFFLVTGAVASGEAQLEQFDLEFVQKFRHDIAIGSGSGVESAFDMRTTSGFGLGTLVGIAHLLLAPFPWQLGGASLRMLLTTPEQVYWWWLFAAGVVPGIAYAVRHRMNDVKPLLVFLAGFGLLYGMIFGNVGVVFRQRAQLLPWLFIFAAIGLEQRALRLGKKRASRFAAVSAGPARQLAPAGVSALLGADPFAVGEWAADNIGKKLDLAGLDLGSLEVSGRKTDA